MFSPVTATKTTEGTKMTPEQIADECRTIMVLGLRADAEAVYVDVAEGRNVVRRLRHIEVSVRDPQRSGSNAIVLIASPEAYLGRVAVVADLERQIKANRKGTSARIRSERASS